MFSLSLTSVTQRVLLPGFVFVLASSFQFRYEGLMHAQDEASAPKSQAKEQKSDIDSDPDRPFNRRFEVPDFPKGTTWLNTGGPVRKRDLQGKFVLMDFWTYCCINCIHIMPTLKKLEEKYDKELVVIGIHSAKFDTEKDDKNITEAILRYEIKHPVINDADHRIWDAYGVQSWPTLLLLDPEGKVVWGTQGEIRFEDMDKVLSTFVKYYRGKGLVDDTPFHIDIQAARVADTPLRFPGKILADEAGKRLFISDSNHNRIVITSLDGELLETIGSGMIGKQDGGYQEATFDHQQGLALHENILYVADTENHLLRKIDLDAKQVTTIAGTGEQAATGFPGYEKLKVGEAFPKFWVGAPLKTALSSPWDLCVHADDLYIAMAGTHQIWKMPLDQNKIGPYAGNSREDIVDGALLPREPYELGFSSFAQPSGLTTDGTWLYVADSEGSSIRAVPFDPEKEVRTVVGTSSLPFNRLFTFGDVDGPARKAKLQHALGVAVHEGKIFVSDTYNNKIKVVDAETGETKSFSGTGKPGESDADPNFDEPSGVSVADGKLFVADTNNHLIRTIDLKTDQVATLKITGLVPPKLPEKSNKPSFAKAPELKLDSAEVKAVDGQVTLKFDFQFATGWKLNDLSPLALYVESSSGGAAIDDARLESPYRIPGDVKEKEIKLPVAAVGKDALKISAVYYYCQIGGEGLCKVGQVVWTIPIEVSEAANQESITLSAKVK